MIYIVCAFYHEARPFIERLNLSKTIGKTYFDKYEGNNISAILSGIGKMNSAVATSRLIPQNGVSENDIIVNIGICGSQTDKIGSCFLINKLIDSDTNESFYPDILFKHPFMEGTLITTSKPEYRSLNKSSKVDNQSENLLYDMEGSGFYEAASKFFSPHQIYLIKIVSDNLTKEKITGEYVQHLVDEHIENIVFFLGNVEKSLNASEFIDKNDYNTIEKVSESLRFTESMKRVFIRNYTRYKIREQDSPDFINNYMNIKVNIKNDVRFYFAKLMEDLSK